MNITNDFEPTVNNINVDLGFYNDIEKLTNQDEILLREEFLEKISQTKTTVKNEPRKYQTNR